MKCGLFHTATFCNSNSTLIALIEVLPSVLRYEEQQDYYDFIIFREVVCTYHVNKFYVIDLVLCLNFKPLQQTVLSTQENDAN